MSKVYRIVFAAFAVTAAPAFGADPVHVALKLKPGLWEFTDTAKVTGPTIFPETVLAHIPPAQRAQYLAETRKQMVEPHKARECIDQAKFEQRAALLSTDCTRKVVSNTAGKFDTRAICRNEMHGVNQNSERTLVASSPVTTTNTLHAVTTRGGDRMIVDTMETGRWISADCKLGNVIQQLP